VDREGIDQVVDTAFAGGSNKRVRAVVIIHGGQLIYERYSPNAEDGAGKIMPGYSMAKSIASALVGILVRDGRLSEDPRLENGLALVVDQHHRLGRPVSCSQAIINSAASLRTG